ncbi:hypothetical protein PIB30_032463 [Stylosanthes scabra]|uniref:Uncharacterized protein n=1 Tax=Stylosanthes scabra TaxID=79078 RepID=A0ABU6SCD1_9FABA|nr:hypothetical protein [Stylosanthes scabra]
MAIITTLCSVLFGRKKGSSTRRESHNPRGTSPLNATSPDRTTEAAASTVVSPDRPQRSNFVVETDNSSDYLLRKELPFPPSKLEAKDSKSFHMRRDISKRLSFSMSLKFPKSFSMAKHQEGNDGGKNNKDKLIKDDAIWMKTIILGEKCNPDEEEEEIIYEEGKGRRMSFSAYHPRMSLSRQCSQIDDNTLSQVQHHHRYQSHI